MGYEYENERSSKLTYFLIGFGLGAVGTLLLAPKMGKEMREAVAGAGMLLTSNLGRELRAGITEATQRGYEAGYEIADELKKAGQEISSAFVEEARRTLVESTERILGAIEEGSKKVGEGVERFSEAVEVGKQAYIEEKYGKTQS